MHINDRAHKKVFTKNVAKLYNTGLIQSWLFAESKKQTEYRVLFKHHKIF